MDAREEAVKPLRAEVQRMRQALNELQHSHTAEISQVPQLLPPRLLLPLSHG